MRIIAKSTLRAFLERHPNAEEPLLAWYRETEKADWESPAQVKARYRSASFVGENRVIFNQYLRQNRRLKPHDADGVSTEIAKCKKTQQMNKKKVRFFLTHF